MESRNAQAAAQQLGISLKPLYRWQQAQAVAEVGSVEVVRDPEVRALRAANILRVMGNCVDLLLRVSGLHS